MVHGHNLGNSDVLKGRATFICSEEVSQLTMTGLGTTFPISSRIVSVRIFAFVLITHRVVLLMSYHRFIVLPVRVWHYKYFVLLDS